MSSEHSNKYLIICPQCRKNIPSFSFQATKDSMALNVSCSCLNTQELHLELKEFINKIQGYHGQNSFQVIKKTENAQTKSGLVSLDNLLNTKCAEHKKEYSTYCEQCQLSLCQDCQSKNLHQNHTVINIVCASFESVYKDYSANISYVIKKNESLKNEYLQKLQNEIDDLNKKIGQLNKIKQEIISLSRNNQSVNADLQFLYMVLYNTVNSVKKPSYQLNQLFNSIKVNEESLEFGNKSSLDLYPLVKKHFTVNYVIHQIENPYECIATLKGHKTFVNSIVQLSDGALLSGSYDKSMKVWNLNKYTLLSTLSGHTGFVSCVAQVSNDLFASGSWDNSIKLWGILDKKCTKTLTGHTGPIYSICPINQTSLASGSEDGTIKFWKLPDGKCEETLTGHKGPIYALAELDNKRLASGSRDKSIKLWNSANSALQATMIGHTSSVYTLAKLRNNKLASGSWDLLIKIWDTKTFVCDASLDGHTDCITSVIELDENEIASGSYDTTVKIWDITSLEEWKDKATLQGHTSCILNLTKLKNGKLVSCSSDNSIMLWNVGSPNK